ncbi:MAG: DUF547 domain-containing protein [Verrucomicrobiales bacterium]|nr:DUF547 domain-containing protein [Verrucomicrobiales bacterium]
MNLTRGRKTRLLGILAILTAWTLHPADGRAGDPFDQTHAEFQRVLVASATQAGVDYAHLKRSPDLLNGYLLRIASLDAAEFASWDRRDRLALLINLYNATTLRVVRDHYPVASIRNIGLLPGAAWRESSVRWGGNAISLDHLEHKILRAEYQEPRIHFALVCAARGCPPLRLEPYRGQDLERQLDEQARAFLAQSEKNRFDPQTSTLWLSPIFKWYTRDFAGSEETLAAYARPFLPASARTQLDLARKVQIQFTDYDWNLNDAPH